MALMVEASAAHKVQGERNWSTLLAFMPGAVTRPFAAQVWQLGMLLTTHMHADFAFGAQTQIVQEGAESETTDHRSTGRKIHFYWMPHLESINTMQSCGSAA
jgi:hypothetical protein